MKSCHLSSTLWLAIFVQFLFSCGDTNKNDPVKREEIEQKSIFNRSNSSSEAELRVRTIELWKQGIGLNANDAEKCYQQEVHRPQVQFFCVLLWAIKEESHPNLSKVLLDRSTENRSWAIASFLQKEVISRLDTSSILQMLDYTSDQPIAFLVRGLEERYLKDPSKISKESSEVLRRLKVNHQLDLEDLVPYLRITWILDRTQFQKILQQKCHPKVSGIAKWYCWKSLAFRPNDLSMLTELRSFFRSLYPQSWDDPTWREFQFLFPQQAKNARRILEAK